MSDQVPVFRVLDCSTAHVTEAEGQQLLWQRVTYPEAFVEGGLPVLAYCYWEGAWLHVSEDGEDFSGPEWKPWPSLPAILKLAREHDCQWVKVDGDGAHLPGLPVYEW